MNNKNWTKLSQETLPDEWSTITLAKTDKSGVITTLYEEINVHEHVEDGVLWYREKQTGYGIPELESIIFDEDGVFYWKEVESIQVGDVITNS